jgi:hypothetical protein
MFREFWLKWNSEICFQVYVEWLEVFIIILIADSTVWKFQRRKGKKYKIESILLGSVECAGTESNEDFFQFHSGKNPEGLFSYSHCFHFEFHFQYGFLLCWFPVSQSYHLIQFFISWANHQHPISIFPTNTFKNC